MPIEDRFLTHELMAKVSEELEAAGFQHVTCRHHIDPVWRKENRPSRPELEPIAWTVFVTEYLLPLPKIKALIEICERNNLVLWWGAYQHEEGRTLFLKVGTTERVSRAYGTPNC